MGWLNIFGLCIVAVILIPNIVFAMKCKDGFENKWHNKYVEIAEQIGLLAALYCLIWIVCFRKSSVFRALALSIIPSLLFLLSGIMSRSILLTIAAVIFAPSHILLSYKNAK